MIMVIFFKFNNFVVIGKIMGQVDGVYGCFSVGVYYVYYIYGWD